MTSRKEPRARELASDFTPSNHSLPDTPKLYNPFSPDFNAQYDSHPVDTRYISIPIPDRDHGKAAKKGAMDPFEVRVRFTQHLQHLNASVTSANKAAQYAIKYRDMDEDLHSCILEQLERVGF